MSQSNLINIEKFLKEKEIFFTTQKQTIRWVKRNLKPKQ